MKKMVPTTNYIREKMSRIKATFLIVFLLSCVVNILMLTGPLFMLQVYDRVLTSRAVPTLVALFVLVVGLFMLMGLIDFFRTRVMSRISVWLDAELAPDTLRHWFSGNSRQAATYRPIEDLNAVRGFLSSGALTFFDLPWIPIFLGVVFLLHFWLGVLATIGALFVVALTIANELTSAAASKKAGEADMIQNNFAEQSRQNSDSIVAMGMGGNVMNRWLTLRDNALASAQKSGDSNDGFGITSKSFRMLLQSAILGLASYFVIKGEITPGTIIASSIIGGRALAPIDQAIRGWRGFKRANEGYRRLGGFLAESVENNQEILQLPEPVGHLQVDNVVKLPPGEQGGERILLQGINFSLQPGDGLGIIGPSASGKTSLAKVLVGLWRPDRGSVRIDGATFDQWDRDVIGRYVGYLPQNVGFLPGTIAENIARFDPDAKDEDVWTAAKLANVHEMILSLPEGYATQIDNLFTPLSGGQQQRIALARAVYRQPKLIVLDEPNSNLDVDGDRALAGAVMALRQAGSVVIVMAHRPSALASVDKVLMIRDGRQIEFGEKAEVLRKVTAPVPQQARAAGE